VNEGRVAASQPDRPQGVQEIRLFEVVALIKLLGKGMD
jgi:hypothetical protein